MEAVGRIGTVLAGLLAAACVLAFPVPAKGAVTGTLDTNAVLGAAGDKLPAPLMAGSAFTNVGKTECADGEDDDNDGLVDTADGNCASATDNMEDNGFGSPDGIPDCQNTVNDDGDGGLIDMADPDCTQPTDADEILDGYQPPECSTYGVDEDGDGDTGFGGMQPDDGCVAAADNSENLREACGNGVDNDADGLIDMADDGCDFPYDDSEGSKAGLPLAPTGVSDAPLAGFPTAGPSFAVLSNGYAGGVAAQSSLEPGPGADNNGVDDGGHGPTVYDLATVRVDLRVAEGLDCLSFDFRYLTNDSLTGQYSDGFLAELGESNFTVPAGEGNVSAPNNFATVAGQPVTNPTGPLTEAAAAGTRFSSSTQTHTATTPLAPGDRTIFLSVYDEGDDAGASAALLDRMILGQLQGGDCVPDSKAPVVKLKRKPKKKSSKKKVRFKFSADEPAVTFECKVNRKPSKPCTSPFKAKAKPGKNKFRLVATDPSGNAAAVKHRWKFEKTKRGK